MEVTLKGSLSLSLRRLRVTGAPLGEERTLAGNLESVLFGIMGYIGCCFHTI